MQMNTSQKVESATKETTESCTRAIKPVCPKWTSEPFIANIAHPIFLCSDWPRGYFRFSTPKFTIYCVVFKKYQERSLLKINRPIGRTFSMQTTEDHWLANFIIHHNTLFSISHFWNGQSLPFNSLIIKTVGLVSVEIIRVSWIRAVNCRLIMKHNRASYFLTQTIWTVECR